MTRELYEAMLTPWKKIEHKVLNDQAELRRRLQRREKTFERVPRPFCLAIRASDKRITPMDAWMSPRWPMEKGNEMEHELAMTSELMRELCRPVRTEWRQPLSDVRRQLGCSTQAASSLHKRGVIHVRGVRGLAGQWKHPTLLITSLIPADDPDRFHAQRPPVLDPGAKTQVAPDPLVAPIWEHLCSRLPDGIEQVLVRKPISRFDCNGRHVLYWYWVCPGCKRNVQTIYFPVGAEDFVRLNNINIDIELPDNDLYQSPHQPGHFACWHCHKLFGFSRADRALRRTWGHLITHLSGGLLFGHEVPRPASFTILRKRKHVSPKRPCPKLDELERYLVDTDLSFQEIARRTHRTYGSTLSTAGLIYKKRHIKRGRPALKEWWSKNHPLQQPTQTAA